MQALGVEAYLLLRDEPQVLVDLALEAARRREALLRFTHLQDQGLSNGIETGKQHHNVPKSEPGGYYATPDVYNAELERLRSIFDPEGHAAEQLARKEAARLERKARLVEKLERIRGGVNVDQHGLRADPGRPEGPGEARAEPPEDRG